MVGGKFLVLVSIFSKIRTWIIGGGGKRIPLPPQLNYWGRVSRLPPKSPPMDDGILGCRPCWCPSPTLWPSISWCFSIHYLHLPLDFIRVRFSFTADVSAPIRSTLHLLTF